MNYHFNLCLSLVYLIFNLHERKHPYAYFYKHWSCASLNLPFLRSFRGSKLGMGCRESSCISLVTASLWGLGMEPLPTADATLLGLSSTPRMASCASRVTGGWRGQTCDRLITQTHHRLTHNSRRKMQRVLALQNEQKHLSGIFSENQLRILTDFSSEA